MTTFILIRHATTDTVGERLAGRMPDVHLNSEGTAQAERLAEGLAEAPLVAIYSSPLERARETAEPIARHHEMEIHSSDSLDEINFGEWTGRWFRELQSDRKWQQFNSFRSGTRIPGGELMSEVQTRVVAELERIRERHPDDAIAIVSHADPIKAVIAYYAGIPLDLFLRVEIDPASVSVIAIGDHGPQILLLNDTGTLSRRT